MGKLLTGDELVEQVAGFCSLLADLTGDHRYGVAARALRRRRSTTTGRREIDDSAALDYVRTLLKTGIAASEYNACTIAAKFFARPHQVPAMRDRLRSKLRR